MRNLRYFPVFAILVGFMLPSCIKETSRGDAFEASFTLDTETVFDGEEFAFTIRTNRREFKVVSFDFPLCPEMLSPDMTCSTRDGLWTHRENIRVEQSQRGSLRLCIQDPETSLVKEFSAMYTAYASAGLTLLIENEVVSSTNITGGLPTVIAGDDFVFSLHAKTERLILKEFSCEFNDGSLSVGKEILFTGGEARITMPQVETADCFTPKTLSLSLLNPDTGRDTTVTASYVTAERFAPSVSLGSDTLIEGETTSVHLSANRSLFQLTEYTAPSWFVLNGYSPDDPGVSLNMDGVATMETKSLGIDKDGSGDINFELLDSEYTLRSVIISVPYTAITKAAPGNITLSRNDFKLKTSQTETVSVSTSTPHSTGLFGAKIISGDSSVLGLYAPSAEEAASPASIAPGRFSSECVITDGRLYLRGMDGKWGAVTVRVYAKGNDKVHKDISVYVRRDVALRLKGEFFEFIHPNPDDMDDIFSDVGGIGWHGFPQSIYAELVSWENRSGKPITALKKDEVSSYVKCFSLNDNLTGRLSVSFIISVGNQVTSSFYYYPYKSYPEPRSRLLTGSGISRVVDVMLPSSFNTTVTESTGYSNRVTCTKLLSQLRDLDCRATYQHGYGIFTMLRENLDCQDYLDFGSFDVSLKSVTYDTDKYTIRYVMNLFEVPGEWGSVAPWWNTVGGERPWITTYND